MSSWDYKGGHFGSWYTLSSDAKTGPHQLAKAGNLSEEGVLISHETPVQTICRPSALLSACLSLPCLIFMGFLWLGRGTVLSRKDPPCLGFFHAQIVFYTYHQGDRCFMKNRSQVVLTVYVWGPSLVNWGDKSACIERLNALTVRRNDLAQKLHSSSHKSSFSTAELRGIQAQSKGENTWNISSWIFFCYLSNH